MEINVFTIIGILANVLMIVAYVPQIIHLAKTKDSTGQSITAWLTWLTGDFFLLAYAISIKDPIVISLATLYIVFTLISLYYMFKYKPKSKKV
jgi:uncharacterized protein with PQ loop repeat